VSKPAAAAPAQTPPAQPAATGATRVLKPPPKPAGSQPAQAAEQAKAVVSGLKKVYVIGEGKDPLREQLTTFLGQIGIGEIAIDRRHGEMIALDKVEESAEARYAFFIVNSDDLNYAMFELGHFVGKLGKNHVCVLHMKDVQLPKNIPGVIVKPIVVKLEEASLSLLKELKAAGYVPSL
jgi:predicted nucleotide-binding protein